MSTFAIRLMAIGLMTVDHVGAFLVWDQVIFRIIGRLAFPLFAWLLANGYRHTRNRGQYFTRMLGFAAVSQIAYLLIFRLFDPNFGGLNIFFTLSTGMVAMWVYERWVKNAKQFYKRFGGVWMLAILAVTAEVFYMDYGWRGIALILSMHIWYEKSGKLLIAMGVLLFWPQIEQLIRLLTGSVVGFSQFQLIGGVGIISWLIIRSYSGQPGSKKWKYLFYVYYPVHLMVLYFLVRIVYRL